MINFLKYRGLTALASLSIFIAFIGIIIYRQKTRGYVFTYSIDFTGGTQIQLKFDKPVTVSQIRDIVSERWENPVIRYLSDHEFIIRVQEFEHDAKGLGEQLRQAVDEGFPEHDVELLQSERVGPGVGKALRWKSIRAVLIALIAMLGYIALRFWSFGFAMGAVAALFHDAVIMLVMFLLLDRAISINIIGAILVVFGYSINDTIVIFSQIRKHLKTMKNASLAQVVNTSLNHTLKRTILTSVSTGLPLCIMLFFGGEALRDISLALLSGIVFGTYSSIYIASPVMMLLYQRKD